MLGSKSNYFHQSEKALQEGRNQLIVYLEHIWLYNSEQVQVYLKAYDYFCQNPNDFDGATLVKDLCHIPGLDINAMKHDYDFLVYNAAANLYTKMYADWLYAKQMEKLGKGGASWLRFAGLKITGLPFCLYAIAKRGIITTEQKLLFFEDYEILMR